ncbi:hypothetical protein F441_11511, partial [Phytophthora nicotianae CJ01A1]
MLFTLGTAGPGKVVATLRAIVAESYWKQLSGRRHCIATIACH